MKSVKSGAFVTHHHGVGKLKSNFAFLSPSYAYGWDWYHNIALPAKKEMDPDNVLNPNNLFTN